MIDTILTALNATGIPFARDAWTEMEPDTEYGVIVMSGVPVTVWADNMPVYQALQGAVYLYTFEGDNEHLELQKVQRALTECGCSYVLTESSYQEDINATMWMWRISIDVSAELAVE